MMGLSKTRGLAVALWLAVLIVAAVGYTRLSLGRSEPLQSFGAAPTFTLADQLERPVSSGDLGGKVVVANFIYTRCGDICPLLSAQMQQLQSRLRAEGLLDSRVQLWSFTVDPAHDSPDVLREYADRHQADPDAWRFLTGPPDRVVPLIVEGFHLGVQALPPTTSRDDEEAGDVVGQSYDVMHSGRFVLIDREGQVRAYYDGQSLNLDQVVRDLHRLIE